MLDGAGGISNAAKAIDIISKADIRIAGIFIIAITGATVLGAESPCSAANHFTLTVFRPSGVFFGRFLVVVYLIEVVAPLPYIAAHVI